MVAGRAVDRERRFPVGRRAFPFQGVTGTKLEFDLFRLCPGLGSSGRAVSSELQNYSWGQFFWWDLDEELWVVFFISGRFLSFNFIIRHARCEFQRERVKCEANEQTFFGFLIHHLSWPLLPAMAPAFFPSILYAVLCKCNYARCPFPPDKVTSTGLIRRVKIRFAAKYSPEKSNWIYSISWIPSMCSN